MSVNKAKDKPSFLIYKSFYDPIRNLSDEELGKLFRAIFEFQISESNPPLSDGLRMAFDFFKNQFCLDNLKYVDKCHQNSDNANTRWKNAKTSKRMRSHNLHAKDADKDKEIDEDTEKEKDKNKKNIKFDEFHFSIATQLADHIKSSKQITVSDVQIKSWANDIGLLEKKDLQDRQTSFEDIQLAIESIRQYDGVQFFPVIESGKSFRQKFGKIENFLQRQNPKSQNQQAIEAFMAGGEDGNN